MQHKSLVGLVVLLFLLSTATQVFAGSVRISEVTFGLGPLSLIADGVLSGLGQQDITVLLNASGIPEITCINQGGIEVPGQSYPKISATGQTTSSGNDPVRKNGKSPFRVEALPPGPFVGEDALLFGCPNANSTARINFVYWTEANISVVDAQTGLILVSQKYTCTTTRFPSFVSCTPVT